MALVVFRSKCGNGEVTERMIDVLQKYPLRQNRTTNLFVDFVFIESTNRSFHLKTIFHSDFAKAPALEGEVY